MPRFYIANRAVDVEELPDVLAVHGDSPAASRVGRIASAVMELHDPKVRAAINAFRQANWEFVSRAEFGEKSSDFGTAVGTVVRLPGDRLAIDNRRLSVKLRDEIEETEAREILRDFGLRITNTLRIARNLFEAVTEIHPDAMAASVDIMERRDERFEFAEPSFIEHLGGRIRPSDPEYPKQWQWSNDGGFSGRAGADISAEEAWDSTLGRQADGREIVVAVIDNGFDVLHSDLAPSIGATSGYFERNWSGSSPFRQRVNGMPRGAHGTKTAGLVGARWETGVGGVGAAPECQLMLLAPLSDEVGDQATLARAIGYAADPRNEESSGRGADIIVCSLGPNDEAWLLLSTLRLHIEMATRRGREGRGMCIFWAASNSKGANIALDEVVSHPDVIAVVGSNRADCPLAGARGASVELIAPGGEVHTTFPGGGHGSMTGNSAAAPCAAGAAALVLAVRPDLEGSQLREVMRSATDPIGKGYDAAGHSDVYGYGRVNAANAIEAARAV